MKKLLRLVRRCINSVTAVAPLHSLRSVLCLLFPGQPQVHELRGRDRLASWEMHSQLPDSQLPGCPWQVQRWAEQFFYRTLLLISPSFTRLFIYLFIPSSPQPVTAPAPPAGDPQSPSAPCAPVGSSCTRASVWRPVGRVSTLRTTPATVRTASFSTTLGVKLEELMVVSDEWTRTTCLRAASEVT